MVRVWIKKNFYDLGPYGQVDCDTHPRGTRKSFSSILIKNQTKNRSKFLGYLNFY